MYTLILALASIIEAGHCTGFLKLDFEVGRGEPGLLPTSRQVSPQSYFKRDGILIQATNYTTHALLVELRIGSDKQKILAQLDTGLSDILVFANDVKCLRREKHIMDTGETNLWELPATTCTELGSFSTDTSTSFHRNETSPDFEFVYPDYSGATGTWASDDVTIGDVTISQQVFGVANKTSRGLSVVGLGMREQEVSAKDGYFTYDNLPFSLLKLKKISKAAYSMYFSPAEDLNGTILFGAVDHAKYSGTLTTFPLSSRSFLNINATAKPLMIKMDGLSIEGGAQGYVTVLSNQYAGMFDLASVNSMLPQALFVKLATAFNGTMDPNTNLTQVDCLYRYDLRMAIKFSNLAIKVPLHEFVQDNGGGNCTLSIQAHDFSKSVVVLGADVLRHMYVVYDLQDEEISVAQVKQGDESDIEVISSCVPGAARAAGYSDKMTATEAFEGTATSIVAPATTYRSFVASSASSVASSSAKSSGGGRSQQRNELLGKMPLLLWVLWAGQVCM